MAFIQEGIIYVSNSKGAGARRVRAAGADSGHFGELCPPCLGIEAVLDGKEGVK
jgi:hypothetical protein